MEENFPSRAYFFILPNWEEDVERKVLWKHFYTNTPFLSPLIAKNTTIFLSNISKLKHNQIIRIQTQKPNFKINQIITTKAKKKKKKKKEKEKKRQKTKAICPSGLRWGRRWVTAPGWANCFGTKMTHLDCVGMNVLESSKKKTKRELEKKKKREWELLEYSWMREKKKIKEGGGGRDRTTCVEEKNKEKKRNIWMKWNERNEK